MLNEGVVQQNYDDSDDEDYSDDESIDDTEIIDDEYNSDEDEDFCPDDESDISDEDEDIEPFPEELEIRNAKYTQLCKSVYFRLESYAMEDNERTNEATLAEVLSYYNWNDINEDQIPRPICTDDVEKILFKVFDYYSEYSTWPWYGITHTALIQH